MTDVLTGTAPPNVSVLASRAQIAAYRVAEFVTPARDGSPVGWPLTPDLEDDAQRDPRVAVLCSDPTVSGRTDADPLVLVQGRCEVFDKRRAEGWLVVASLEAAYGRSADSARRLMPFSIRRSMAKSPISIRTKLKNAKLGVSHR